MLAGAVCKANTVELITRSKASIRSIHTREYKCESITLYPIRSSNHRKLTRYKVEKNVQVFHHQNIILFNVAYIFMLICTEIAQIIV